MIRPIGDCVLLRPALANRVTASGTVLPDLSTGPTATKLSSEYGAGLLPAEVISIGPGKRIGKKFYDTEGFSVGDIVLIDHDAGDRIIEGVDAHGISESLPVGTEFRMVRAEEIILNLS